MAPMAKLTFEAVLNWFASKNSSKWHISVQAAQFDCKEYISAMSPATGMITLNISANATRHFHTYDDHFSFWSRFQGKEIQLEIPYTAVFVAFDPEDGIPNPFPFFEDYGDPEPFEAPVQQATEQTVELPSQEELTELNRLMKDNGMDVSIAGFSRDESGTLVINLDLNDNVAQPAPSSTTTTQIDNVFVKRDNVVEFPKLLTHDNLEKKLRERHWTVYEGGKGKPVEHETMPFIDTVYREKRERMGTVNLGHVQDAKLNAANGKSGTQKLNSGGSNGVSSFFPDLDVSKCHFQSKRIPRPSWMTVHQGGQK